MKAVDEEYWDGDACTAKIEKRCASFKDLKLSMERSRAQRFESNDG
jgi:hypothetical protein